MRSSAAFDMPADSGEARVGANIERVSKKQAYRIDS
jgi:hypothetical protein